MGKVMNRITLTNTYDVGLAEYGLLPPEQVRTESIEALVDTGAIMLAIPADLAERLGFPVREMRKVKTATGAVEPVPCVGDVLFEVLGRKMTCGAIVLPAGTTPLIGQLQLEELDLIVDPKNREVRVNPASPDMPTLDMLAAG
jgi:clan AA aspartic protease